MASPIVAVILSLRDFSFFQTVLPFVGVISSLQDFGFCGILSNGLADGLLLVFYSEGIHMGTAKNDQLKYYISELIE